MQTKFVLVLAASCLSLLSEAQIQKGTIVPFFDIGNLRAIGWTNNESIKNTHTEFNPGLGYFIKNNWEAGIGLRYADFHYLNKQTTGQRYNGRTLGIKAYTNYYFFKKKLQPYLTFQTGYDYNKGDNTIFGITTRYNYHNFFMAIGGGLNWRVTPRFSLFTEATYWKDSPFNRDGHSRLNLTFGTRFYFIKRKRK